MENEIINPAEDAAMQPIAEGRVNEAAAHDADAGTEAAGGTADGEATPPPYDPEALGRDIAMLRAIGSNAQTAAFLTELAGGGEASQLLRKYFPDEFAPAEADSEAAPDSEPAMFRSRMQAPDEAQKPCPTFLAHMHRGFWD